MPEMFMQQSGQAPARAASSVDAELQRLDAQLELAAKKAALAGMQRQAAAGGGDAPAPASGRVTYEKDGVPVTLENPTIEQLEAIGLSAPRQPELQGGEIVGMVSIIMGAAVLLTALILWHRRKMRVPQSGPARETDARIVRIENAIESIAVEVERISEGQRFTSRMLADGAAVPIAVPDRFDAVLRNRGEGQR